MSQPAIDLRAFIRDVPDFPKPGILFKDITPLLADVTAFRAAVEGLAAPFRRRGIDLVAAPEARGFIFAAPLALALGAGFVPIRKPGKLPYEDDLARVRPRIRPRRRSTSTRGSSAPGRRVLLVDDVLATGGTMRACRDLVGLAGGEVVALAFLVELCS